MRGQGTFNDPYLVETVADFVSMGGYGTGVYFELANDIDFGSTTYLDGQHVINTFRGIFDGKFHKLLNFKTYGIAYLIRYIQGDANYQAVFKNVGIENISIDSHSVSVTNPPLGDINGPGVVEKVYVTGTITNTMNAASTTLIGTLLRGMVGGTNSAFRDCYSMVNVVLPNAERFSTDGSCLMLYSHQASGSIFERCAFFGTVTIKSGYAFGAHLIFGGSNSAGSISRNNVVDVERSGLVDRLSTGVLYLTTAQSKKFASYNEAIPTMSSGATTITMDNVSYVEVGDIIEIDYLGANPEFRTVTSIEGNLVRFTPGLTSSHNSPPILMHVGAYRTFDKTIWSKDTNVNYGYPFIKAFNFPKSWATTVRSPLTSLGYQDIRDMVQANWTHIQLSKYDGTPIIRLNCGDSRVAWTHNPGAQVLELTITLKGSDVDYAIPNTFGLIELYKLDSGGVPLTHDLFTPQSISTVSDTLYLKYRIQIPKVG